MVNLTPMTPISRLTTSLGITQTIAWASSYYLIAILATPISEALGVSTVNIYAAFSTALVLSAIVGPVAGRLIDKFGGKPVLLFTNLVFAAGLAILSVADTIVVLWLGWITLGLAMGMGLYEAAFATLARLLGSNARQSITGITLIAGFASTIGWPLTTWSEAEFGWRVTCLIWAGIHVFIAMPLNYYFIPDIEQQAVDTPANDAENKVTVDLNMVLLAIAFGALWTVASGVAAHLPGILQEAGISLGMAVVAGMCLGPAQVLARVIEFGYLKNYHPIISAKFCAFAHPLGALLLILGLPFKAFLFVILHGVSSGLTSIIKGTLPLSIYGAEHYGYRLGLIGIPGRIGQAIAPVFFSIVIENYGLNVLWFTSALLVVALVCFSVLSKRVC
jgi:predicted MFS family arabinose efflux permease